MLREICRQGTGILILSVILAEPTVATALDLLDQGVVEDTLSAYDAERSVTGCVGWPRFKVDDGMLSPLMLLHWLLAVKLLLADVTFEGPVVSVRSLVNLAKGDVRGISKALSEI